MAKASMTPDTRMGANEIGKDGSKYAQVREKLLQIESESDLKMILEFVDSLLASESKKPA